MYEFARGQSSGFCDACFSGNYPVPLGDEVRTRQLHLFEASDR
jgi:glutamine phosphoribosylpyrophosphate amidotransferase